MAHSTNMDKLKAAYYGLMVNDVYLMYDHDPENINPSLSDYPSFPSGFELLLNIQMTDFFGDEEKVRYYGFVAKSKLLPTTLVVAIRGTSDWMEWWDDFHWELVRSTQIPEGYVAQGFQDIYRTMKFALPGHKDRPFPASEMTQLPNGIDLCSANNNLIIVGHSLGSALATLYAADLAWKSQANTNSVVYTLASPRVGDKNFAAAYNKMVATNYRVYNWPDIVPNFPKDPFDQYQHVKGGFEIDSLDFIEMIEPTIACFHAIGTYIYVLDQEYKNLLGECMW